MPAEPTQQEARARLGAWLSIIWLAVIVARRRSSRRSCRSRIRTTINPDIVRQGPVRRVVPRRRRERPRRVRPLHLGRARLADRRRSARSCSRSSSAARSGSSPATSGAGPTRSSRAASTSCSRSRQLVLALTLIAVLSPNSLDEAAPTSFERVAGVDPHARASSRSPCSRGSRARTRSRGPNASS